MKERLVWTSHLSVRLSVCEFVSGTEQYSVYYVFTNSCKTNTSSLKICSMIDIRYLRNVLTMRMEFVRESILLILLSKMSVFTNGKGKIAIYLVLRGVRLCFFILIVFGLCKIPNGKYSQQCTEPLWLQRHSSQRKPYCSRWHEDISVSKLTCHIYCPKWLKIAVVSFVKIVTGKAKLILVSMKLYLRG
jgi:hypothetical protein